MLIFIADYKLLKRNHFCDPDSTKLTSVYSVAECASQCRNLAGCMYFIVGNNGGWEKCYWEKIEDPSCPGGWKKGSYNFYQLPGKFCYINKYPLGNLSC